MESRMYETRYRELWLAGVESCPAAAGNRSLTGSSFCARHHSFRMARGWPGARRHGVFINETFDSVMECLACYRWFRVPLRLRALRSGSGAPPDRNVEELLDRAGYSISLVVEELFGMLDECLGGGVCTGEDLERIRLAYNGIGDLRDPARAEIVCWGPVAEVLANSSLHDNLAAEGDRRSGLLVLVDSGLFDPANRSHMVAADRFLRRTSAV